MSTSHKGRFCGSTGKMILTKQQAADTAASMHGMGTYKCQFCKEWHLYTRSDSKRRPNKKRESVKFYNAPKPKDIFEEKTKDYDPDEMVPSIPPDDFTGDINKWMAGLVKLGISSGETPRIALMRHADWSRLLDASEE